jgi:hypothetical protein
VTARSFAMPTARNPATLRHRPVWWALVLAVVLCCWLRPQAASGYAYHVVLTDGRTIPVDLYGEAGEEMLLHRDGRVMKVPRALVKEVRRVRTPDERSSGLVARREVGGETLTTVESDVSTLGWGSAQEEYQWLEDVLLQKRGDPCAPRAPATGVAVRWVHSPSVSRFGGGEAAQQALEAAVSELNEALVSSDMALRLGPPENRQAEVQVFFKPRSAFPTGLPVDPSHLDGYALILRIGSARAVIQAAQVWVAEDPDLARPFARLDSAARREVTEVLLREHWQAVVLHELVHALGLTHSAVFRDSTMYCRLENHQPDGSRQTRLSRRDRKALAFFYTYVRPGDRADELRRVAEAHWFDF